MQITLDMSSIIATVGMGLVGIVWMFLRESIRNGDERVRERVTEMIASHVGRIERLEQDFMIHTQMLKELQSSLQRIELQLAALNSHLTPPSTNSKR